MSSIERVGFGAEFTELVNQSNQNQETNNERAVDNSPLNPGAVAVNEQDENSVQNSLQTPDRLEERANVLAENQQLAINNSNDDGDSAQVSEDGAQLAQNVDVNSPLALD